MAFNYSPKIVTDGLVLYLDAANPNSYVSGSTTWRDISRGGNNGALINGPTYSSANGGSIVFDGTNDYVNFGSSFNLNTNIGFTISLYFKITTYSVLYPTLFTIKTSIGSSLCLLLSSIDGSYSPLTFGWNGNSYRPTSLSNLSTNIWYQLSLIYNGNGVNNSSNFSIYLNNIFFPLSVGNDFSGIGNVNTLGTLNTGTSNFWYNGNIASTQIYNRALSATEVLQNYNATKTRFGLT
jgi:hypothetical protein